MIRPSPAIYRLGQNYQFIAFYEQKRAYGVRDVCDAVPRRVRRSERKRTRPRRSMRHWLSTPRHSSVVVLVRTDKSIELVNLFIGRTTAVAREFFDQAAGVFFDMGQIYEQRKDWASKVNVSTSREYLEVVVGRGRHRPVDRTEVKLGEISVA